jgi:hypothetical protein
VHPIGVQECICLGAPINLRRVLFSGAIASESYREAGLPEGAFAEVMLPEDTVSFAFPIEAEVAQEAFCRSS